MSAELDTVLSSQVFARPERLRRFLRFIVEEALASRPVNEYRIAVEVYDRKSSFDPAADSIVRVEIGRLRQKLVEYYNGEGCDRALLIEVPPRTYTPVFRSRRLPLQQAVPVSTTASVEVPAVPALSPEPAPAVRPWYHSRYARAISIVAALAIVGICAAWFFPRVKYVGRAAVAAGEVSVAVLPFADLSRTKDQGYLGDELAEEILDALSRVSGLHVVSRTSSFAYRGKSEDVRVIGRELNAHAILEGSVRIHDGKCRITAQLIDVATGFHIWSETYEPSTQAPFAVEQEIASGIAAALRGQLAPASARASRHYAPKLETYQLYLEGMHYAKRWSADSLSKGIELLERAVAADPNFATAWAALAEARTVLAIHAGFPPDAVMPQAKSEAMRAISLDEDLPLAHASLALVNGLYEWRWAEAQKEFVRAHALAPSDAGVHEAYIMGYLVPTGALDEALRQANEALTFDPTSPRVTSVAALVHSFRGEPDEAMALLQKTLEIDPEFLAARLAMGSTYAAKGMFNEAVQEIRKGRGAWESGVGRSALACMYARMGKRDQARALLAELLELSKKRYVSAVYIAQIHLALGDRAAALDALEKAYEQRSSGLALLKINPRFAALRTEPRFRALLEKIGLS